MNPASMALVQPALRDYREALVAAALVCPGGALLPEDAAGIRRRVARAHSITPEDLQRWHKLQGWYDGLSRKDRRALALAVA